MSKELYQIYYTSKALNEARKNYTITEKELLEVVYAFEKFRSYLLRTKVVVHRPCSIVVLNGQEGC